MSNSKCPELARRFSDQVPKTVTEMMKRVDDFVKSEEAFKITELPRWEFSDKGQGTPYRGSRPPRVAYGGRQHQTDYYNNFSRGDHYQPYVPPRVANMRYDNRRQEVNHISLYSLSKRPKEILATEIKLQFPPCPPMVETPMKENLDRYCDYHGVEITVREIGIPKRPRRGLDEYPNNLPLGPFNFNSDRASGFLQRAVGPNRLGGTRSSIRKRGSFSKNDDEVYGSKGVIPIQQYPGTYRNERTQGCVVHHSRYDKVPYPKGNRYSGYPNNFCVRMPTIGEEASRTRRESQRGRTGQTKRARRRRNTHPPCFREQKVTIGTQFSKECRLGE
ncbi:hypothetical protein Tco_1344407 [Tanacetum coccineum]